MKFILDFFNDKVLDSLIIWVIKGCYRKKLYKLFEEKKSKCLY